MRIETLRVQYRKTKGVKLIFSPTRKRKGRSKFVINVGNVSFTFGKREAKTIYSFLRGIF
jgi:hypothetical protein